MKSFSIKIQHGAAGFSRAIPRVNCLGRRAGVTLIELLIVIGVLTILATVSLTSVKGLLKDQKVSQASRLVQQYIETARIRAITNGRPVAVFMERSNLQGMDTQNGVAPISGNFTATRMFIGEVFPPYVGDVDNAVGELWDVNMMLNSSVNPAVYPDRPSRGGVDANGNQVGFDGFADQIRFAVGDVLSGFGTGPNSPGMVRRGDLIEIEGSSRLFEIEHIDYIPAVPNATPPVPPKVAVTFFNPPGETFLSPNAVVPNYFNSLASPPRMLEPKWSTLQPVLPVSEVATGINAEMSNCNCTTQLRQFKIYRRPRKSLVGAITLPRGTCIDMFASGAGPTGAAGIGAFGLPAQKAALAVPVSPANVQLSPRSYARVAIIFDASGKPQRILRDEKSIVVGQTTQTVPFTRVEELTLDAKIYLLVGRTDQVVSNVASSLVRPAEGERDEILPNILDPANSWVSINPLTGLITSSPVSAVSDNTILTAVNNNNYGLVVQESRTLASVGVNNAGQ